MNQNKTKMVKYYLKSTGKEVKVGETIEVEMLADTVFGKSTAKVDVLVTQSSLEILIQKGIVVKEDDSLTEEQLKKHWDLIKPYIRRFARKEKVALPDAIAVFAYVGEISPVAHIDMLLEQIAEVKNRDKERDSQVYWLNPANNYAPSRLMGKSSCVIPFYSYSDAIEAYGLIKPFVKAMIGGE